MAEDQDVKTTRRRSAKTPTFQLAEVPCPDQCSAGQVPVFDQAAGQILAADCGRCLGAGVVEVQRG